MLLSSFVVKRRLLLDALFYLLVVDAHFLSVAWGGAQEFEQVEEFARVATGIIEQGFVFIIYLTLCL